MSKYLGLSRGKDLCSFVCDLHLPGPPWTQGQGWVAMRTLVLASWGFGCAASLSISLRLANVWPCGLWCDHRRSLTDMVAGDLMSLSCLSSLETWPHPSAPRKGVARKGLSLTLTSRKCRGLVGHYTDFGVFITNETGIPLAAVYRIDMRGTGWKQEDQYYLIKTIWNRACYTHLTKWKIHPEI